MVLVQGWGGEQWNKTEKPRNISVHKWKKALCMAALEFQFNGERTEYSIVSIRTIGYQYEKKKILEPNFTPHPP